MTITGRCPERILMTADAMGGVWTYALVLSDALAAYDVEVHLATMGASLKAQQRRRAAELSNLTVYEGDYKLEWMEEPWEDVAAAGEWLLELERKLNPDVVHLNGYTHGALGWDAPVLVVGHSCVYSWFVHVTGELPPPWWERYRRAVSRGLQNAEYVAAPTAAMLRSLERHYGSFSRSDVIYNGRSSERFPPGEKRPFVLVAGRLWDAAKNVRAVQEVASELPWPVRVAGENENPNGETSTFKHVELLGQLAPEELAAEMASASIYVLPARYEPFGLTPLEAGMAGCALALGDIPSLREVWGEAACYVSPEEPAAIRSTLCRLIEDEALRDEMGRRARKHALTYTPERMVRDYLEVYSVMLESQPIATTG